jgi:hypothetical protein
MNHLSLEADISEAISEAFPHNEYSFLTAKMVKCFRLHEFLFFDFDIIKTSISDTRADPSVLPYLAWLTKDSYFVPSYLGAKVISSVHSHVNFSFHLDPTVDYKVPLREAEPFIIVQEIDQKEEVNYILNN